MAAVEDIDRAKEEKSKESHRHTRNTHRYEPIHRNMTHAADRRKTVGRTNVNQRDISHQIKETMKK
jgi:hypothetical protein